MIQRVVMIRLDPGYRKDADLHQIAVYTEEVLSGCQDVVGVRAGIPSDERTRRDWDLVILVELDDMESVQRYRDDPVHRKYVDVFLRPMLEKIRVWNFERTGG